MLSSCIELPGDDLGKRCIRRCIRYREERLDQIELLAQHQCESDFVEREGHADLTCVLPGSDTLGASVEDLEGRFKKALADKDGEELDRLASIDATQTLARRGPDCTARCRARGPEILKAERDGPGLVKKYKRCMVSAGSTMKARKLPVYESDLYCDYLYSASDRCRSASRCDWLEEFSMLECTYASPGVDC